VSKRRQIRAWCVAVMLAGSLGLTVCERYTVAVRTSIAGQRQREGNEGLNPTAARSLRKCWICSE
jgi:hypothetical protein